MTVSEFLSSCDMLSGEMSTMEENFVTTHARKQLAELRACVANYASTPNAKVNRMLEQELLRLDTVITFFCDAEDDAEA